MKTRVQDVDVKELQAIAAKELYLRRKARNNLLEFCSYTLPGFTRNWHLELTALELEKVAYGKTKRLMIFEPPRHGKSELASVRFPAWTLGKFPQKQFIACSYSGSLAFNFSRACRQVMQADKYQKLWPVKFRTDADTHWQLMGKENNRSNYIAAGVGGPISGEGADVLLIDDPVKNAEEADSFVIREKQWEWYKTTARTRLQPGGAVVLILTRWHEDDLAGRLLKAAKEDPAADQWKVILLPAVNDGFSTIPVEIGPYDALWKDKYDSQTLAQVRATVGPRTWGALYQQRPVSGQGKIWNRSWFKFYKRNDLPKSFEEQIQSWDMTFKETKDSDFVVGQVWGRIGRRKFLLYQVRERMDFVKASKAVEKMYVRFPQSLIKLVEDKANGSAIISALKGVVPGLKPMQPIGSKEARWSASSQEWELGNVYFPDPTEQPWVNDIVDELCGVPEGALHDDQADASAQAVNFWRMSHRSAIMEARI